MSLDVRYIFAHWARWECTVTSKQGNRVLNKGAGASRVLPIAWRGAVIVLARRRERTRGPHG
jgi:hypothetical protein